jgi:DNA-binding NtrC family response regulator
MNENISEAIKILLIDDESDALDAMRMGLSSIKSLQALTTTSRNEAINILKNDAVDIVLTDLKLKDGSGLEILNFIQENYPSISVIVITAYGSVDSAIQAIRGGAYDYLQKPVRMADIKRLINRITETIYLRRENIKLREQLHRQSDTPQLVGVSVRFRKIIDFVKQVAPAQSTILVTGESGTGKEVIANAIEFYSNRHGKPFIKINCGAIPENLLEAELFGYEKGAFTGAYKQKKGKIEFAHEGTLFLDEIGDLPKQMQVKLLRVIQNGEFERLGDTVTQKVNIRLIAASNSDLQAMVKNGSFREDLFYRLNVISIQAPPLRERLEDIPALTQFLIEKYNQINEKDVEGVEPAVLKTMLRYSWNGNIRELENMIERAVVLSAGKILKLHHFPALAVDADTSAPNFEIEVGQSLAEFEKQIIVKTLQYHNYDKNKTAMTLQIGLATLYRKIKEYNIDDI